MSVVVASMQRGARTSEANLLFQPPAIWSPAFQRMHEVEKMKTENAEMIMCWPVSVLDTLKLALGRDVLSQASDHMMSD